MTRTVRAKAVGQSIALSVLLGLVAWGAVNMGRGFRVWQHGAGHTETIIYVLPERLRGFGTMSDIETLSNGTRARVGILTRYGCFGVATYDLRFFFFDPWTGTVVHVVG